MNKNYIISDDSMANILLLSEYNKNIENSHDKLSQKCYIQSFTISPLDVKEMLFIWSSMDVFSKATEIFLNHLKVYPDRNFYYRYVGSNSVSSKEKGDEFFHYFTKFLKKTPEGLEWLYKNCRYFYVEKNDADICRYSRSHTIFRKNKRLLYIFLDWKTY